MPSATTRTSGNKLIVEKILNAPRELVFDAWTQSKHLIHWWGPIGFTTTSHELSVKPGGVWRFMMHGPDGRDYPNKIIFIEVTRPERLVYKHAGDADTEPVSFSVIVSFEKLADSKTKLTMESTFSSAEELAKINKEYGAIEGARQTIDRLEEYLIKMN